MNLQDYLNLQQMQMNGQAQPIPQNQMPPSIPMQPMQRNPIMEGARAGLQSARASFEMSDAQRQRAMGNAMVNFASHMASLPRQGNFGPGFAGQLNAITASLSPAMQAYQRDRMMAEEANAAEEMARMRALQHQQTRADKALYESMKDAREREKMTYRKERDNYRNTDAYEHLQEEKHMRLLNKDLMDFRKSRNKMINERMKEVMEIGTTERAKARRIIEEQVDAELKPIYDDLMERKNFGKKENRVINRAEKAAEKEAPQKANPSGGPSWDELKEIVKKL